MNVRRKLLVLVATMSVGAAPAVALAAGHSKHVTGPKASQPAKAKAYGKDCQDQSKTHVAGTPGTPFSKCVTDMAKLAKGTTTDPRKACKDESKKHVAGEHGTPFSRCVSSGAKLRKALHSGS